MTDAARLAGRYINLDRTPDRAAYMEAQFERLGLVGIQRVRAADALQIQVPDGIPLLPGEYACMLSHLAAIESGPADAALLVLEDDMELCGQIADLVGRLASGPLSGYDVVFLECQPQISLSHASALWNIASHLIVKDANGNRGAAGIELVDARPVYKWSTAAYLVSPVGRERLLQLVPGWTARPSLPFDRRMEQAIAAGQLRAAVTVPFLATTGLQWHGRSTIGLGGRMPAEPLMLLRRLLYAGNVDEAAPLAREIEKTDPDPLLAMFALVLREVAGWDRDTAVRRRTEGGNPD
jgi:GR25 family glycosyltransferase involved in LPS biosynthesis